MNLQKYEALKLKVIQYVQARNLPTIRDLAQQFRMSQADMLTLIEDTDELDYNIGVMIRGVGTYQFGQIGDYTVEEFT